MAKDCWGTSTSDVVAGVLCNVWFVLIGQENGLNFFCKT